MNNYNLSKCILDEMNNNKKDLLALLESVLKNKLADIEISGNETYENIIEYNFSLIKAVVKYENGKKEEIYLKMIRGGKIKESIFCYWSILYDEFLKNTKREADKKLQKAIITQITSEESFSSLLLTLNTKLNYYAEISLIELKRFLEEKNIYRRWCSNLEITNGDILFIGRKMY